MREVRIGVYGDAEGAELGGMGMELMVEGVGRVRRLVRSKVWQNEVGMRSSGCPGAGALGLWDGDGGAVGVSTSRGETYQKLDCMSFFLCTRK